jgi:integrase
MPSVLSRAEAQRLLAHLNGTRWLMASLLYGAGLRLRECLKLRVKDMDFDYRQILVRDAKGAKDRVTMLPGSVIERPPGAGRIKRRDLTPAFRFSSSQSGACNLEVAICDFKLERPCGRLNALHRESSSCVDSA